MAIATTNLFLPAQADTRSPSPVFPGAWPPTRPSTPGYPPLLQMRSNFCPTSAGPFTEIQPHADRVSSFHQQLPLSLSSSPGSPTPTSSQPSVFTQTHAMPASILISDDPGLTRFAKVRFLSFRPLKSLPDPAIARC